MKVAGPSMLKDLLGPVCATAQDLKVPAGSMKTLPPQLFPAEKTTSDTFDFAKTTRRQARGSSLSFDAMHRSIAQRRKENEEINSQICHDNFLFKYLSFDS